MNNLFEIRLGTASLQLRRGDPAQTTIHIKNNSDQFQSYGISVAGTAASWAKLEYNNASALPGQEFKPISLSLSVPPNTYAGTYRLVVRITCDTLAGLTEEAELVLEVETAAAEPAYSSTEIQVTVENTPPPLPQPAPVFWELKVTNIGNRLGDYVFYQRGLPGTWCVVEPPRLTLKPAETAKVRVVVIPSPNAPAGIYNFVFDIYSQLTPHLIKEIPCTFEIKNAGMGNRGIPAGAPSAAAKGPLRLEVAQRSIMVIPGGSTQVGLTMVNQSQKIMPLELSAPGLPVGWVTFSRPAVDLRPGENIPVMLTIAPDNTARPGIYLLAIQALDRSDLTQTVTTAVSIEIVKTAETYAPRFLVKISPNQQQITPAGQTSFELTVSNLTARYEVAHLEIEGEGLNKEWFRIEQGSPQIAPFGEGRARLVVKLPPDISNCPAGLYTMRVRAFSDINPRLEDVANCRLEVPVGGDYTIEMPEEEGRGVGNTTYQVTVRNRSNANLHLEMGADPTTANASYLQYSFRPPAVDLPVGGTTKVDVVVAPLYPVNSDTVWNFKVRCQGYYALAGGAQRVAEIRTLGGVFVQEVATSLLVSLTPPEAKAEQSTWYEVVVNNRSTERVKVRLSLPGIDKSLAYSFKPEELTIPPKDIAKTTLTLKHKHKARSNKPDEYNFQVKAEYAAEGLPRATEGITNGRFIHQSDKKGFSMAWLFALIPLVAGIGAGAYFIPPLLNPATPTAIAGLPTVTIPTFGLPSIGVPGGTTTPPGQLTTTAGNSQQTTTAVVQPTTTTAAATTTTAAPTTTQATTTTAPTTTTPPVTTTKPPTTTVPPTTTTPPPLTSLVASSVISQATINPGNFGVVRVDCPAGTFAVGGGVDPFNVLTMKVTSSAPVFAKNNNRLFLQPDGSGTTPIGWQASVRNDDTTAKNFKVAVICVKELPNVSVVITSATVGVNSFNNVRPVCPTGSVAIGGGIDLENILTMKVTSSAPTFAQNNNRLIFQPNGTAALPVGWQVSARNDDTAPKSFKAAVICTTSLPGGTVQIGSSTATTNNFGSVILSCPAGTGAINGGLDLGNVNTMKVTASGPSFVVNSNRLIFQPDGPGAIAKGWQVSARNDDAATGEIKAAVICAKVNGAS